MTQITLKPKVKATASKKRAKPDTEDEDSAPELGSLHDDSLLSATPPSLKKQKKAPALKVKKAMGKPLQALENEALNLDGVDDPKPKKGGATDQYQKAGFSFLFKILLCGVDLNRSSRNWNISSSVLTHTSVQ